MKSLVGGTCDGSASHRARLVRANSIARCSNNPTQSDQTCGVQKSLVSRTGR